MPKKSKAKSRDDILIEILITTPDGSLASHDMRVVNPTGCILGSKVNDAEQVYANLTKGMAGIYGAGHIK